jgi:hypothetical protein
MATEPDDTEQFDRLLQLLAIKRYEQPPPGFFERFPREVHLRILAQSNSSRTWVSKLGEESNWFRHIVALLDKRPYLAGVAGVMATGLVVSAILYTDYGPISPTVVAVDGSFSPTVTITPSLETANATPWAAAGAPLSSTNPILDRPVPAMLFNGSTLQSQPATFDIK